MYWVLQLLVKLQVGTGYGMDPHELPIESGMHGGLVSSSVLLGWIPYAVCPPCRATYSEWLNDTGHEHEIVHTRAAVHHV